MSATKNFSPLTSSPGVIPAKAGIQFFFRSHSAINLDARLRGHDEFCAVQTDIAC